MTAPTEADTGGDALDAARRLMADGACLEAVEVLTEANRRRADPAVEAMLVEARHRAFAELPQVRSDAPWPTPVPDVFAGVAGIPEIDAAELTAGAPRRRTATPRLPSRAGSARPARCAGR